MHCTQTQTHVYSTTDLLEALFHLEYLPFQDDPVDNYDFKVGLRAMEYIINPLKYKTIENAITYSRSIISR